MYLCLRVSAALQLYSSAHLSAIPTDLPVLTAETCRWRVQLVGWGSTVAAAYHVADGLVAERGAQAVAGVVALSALQPGVVLPCFFFCLFVLILHVSRAPAPAAAAPSN